MGVAFEGADGGRGRRGRGGRGGGGARGGEVHHADESVRGAAREAATVGGEVEGADGVGVDVVVRALLAAGGAVPEADPPAARRAAAAGGEPAAVGAEVQC